MDKNCLNCASNCKKIPRDNGASCKKFIPMVTEAKITHVYMPPRHRKIWWAGLFNREKEEKQ